MKVVFHLSELEKWSMAQGNIKNLLAIDATIEVVLLVMPICLKSLQVVFVIFLKTPRKLLHF